MNTSSLVHEAANLKRYLPRINSPGYHILLAVTALLVLGPLGGISAAFMNFSLGFFVGGQVLAGILGSTVTLAYGPEGKHGANYVQTMASSVAGMCGMGVLIQAMVWLGLPEPPVWKLILYFMSIGMFGVGLGMLYTPYLVDRRQLTFPSGFAVANILHTLTDKNQFKRSVTKLGGGVLAGYLGGLCSLKVGAIEMTGFSASTFGAGMIVGARIAIPGLALAMGGELLKPYFISIGWLEPGTAFRKIGFIIALGMIVGAAILDIGLVLIQASRQLPRQNTTDAAPPEDWKRVNVSRLLLWVMFWGVSTVVIGSQVLHQPVFLLTVAVGLCFLFVLVNGISLGVSDINPISSAFVMTVFILASLGLKDAGIGLMCASVLLIACAEGGDMQQDRSTGWRLGTNRIVQFRYQIIGIAMGAVLGVALAKLFLSAFPVLRVDQLSNPRVEGALQWQSAMTFKFVGALREITNPKPHVMKALQIGILVGLFAELARKLLKSNPRYRRFSMQTRAGRSGDFLLDAILLPSPYAASFGGFVNILTAIWWAAGGTLATIYTAAVARFNPSAVEPVEAGTITDMNTSSLLGGGLIAGNSLAGLSVGLFMLLRML